MRAALEGTLQDHTVAEPVEEISFADAIAQLVNLAREQSEQSEDENELNEALQAVKRQVQRLLDDGQAAPFAVQSLIGEVIELLQQVRE